MTRYIKKNEIYNYLLLYNEICMRHFNNFRIIIFAMKDKYNISLNILKWHNISAYMINRVSIAYRM